MFFKNLRNRAYGQIKGPTIRRLRGRAGVRVISEGNISQTDFEGEKYLAKKYLGKKYLAPKTRTPVYVGEKRLEVWEKEVFPEPNHP